MRTLQEAKLTMYKTVISHCELHYAIIVSMPAFEDAYKLFKETVLSIDNTAQQEAQVISGIAANKKKFRKALIQQTAALAAKVVAFAISINNNELKEKVDFSNAALSKLRDDELHEVCLNIMQAADANLVLLAPYNITSDTISNLNDFISEFTGSGPRPRNAVTSRSSYIKMLKELHITADNILKNKMDKMVLTFVVSHAEFFDTYTNNRIIFDSPTKPTQLRGTITNSKDGDVLANAIISIPESGMMTTTDENGRYAFKPVAIGTHTIKITKEGFLPKIIAKVIAKLGQTTTLDAELDEDVAG